jgi:hypothetical protein
MSEPDYIINPRTNRKLRVGSMFHKKYLVELQEAKLKETPPVVEDPKSNLDEKIVETSKSVLTDLAVKNKKFLSKSDDPETELRKMLYEKLCIAKKKKKSKQSSRYKFYVSSESDESSESESD